MDTGVKTKSRQSARARKRAVRMFAKFPPEYYGYALQWCYYSKWTIEEAANLLTGCVPHREMFLPGEEHTKLDEEILAIENKIRSALGKELKVIKGRKYFARTYIDSSDVLGWVRRQGIDIPEDLRRAARETQLQQRQRGYSTPCLEAIEWVIDTYWLEADLRDPPTPGKIIQALLQQFPELSGQECEMVEQVTRHPLAKPDEAD